ncbi:structural protein [Cellulophaga phage phi39:1]|uniref:structural protein n=1 Tax=Cellulophaga phage phi39:1 TaxID=1327993 RepID=UPI0003517C18|nr:structural protein [Cellulophaga phage phi39:1]AGO49137.1 structural protein [Cellulophaga phage phi39:1]
MNYTVDIIDTENDDHVISYEYAAKSSIVLSWNGGDSKDDQFIVGSTLAFTLEVHVSKMQDGKFRHLFTGNENKYNVIMYKTDDPGVIVWSGFLLPDSYSEPYTNGTIYPGFEATDGLGRLKGRILPDDFYTKENSVVSYIANILKLTGLELPINIAPAIENKLVKRYDLIYLSGLDFVNDEGAKDKAYDILKDILESMLCVCYQCDNEWYIDGLNQRHLKQVVYYNYDFDGNYLDYTKKNRLLKNFDGEDNVNISVIAPYKDVTVSHEKIEPTLPSEISEEKNEGWAVGDGVEAAIFPTYWFGNGLFLPISNGPNYKVQLLTNAVANELNFTQYISLLKKIPVNQFDKFVMKAVFTSDVSAAQSATNWTFNINCIQVLVNNVVIHQITGSFEEKEIEINLDIYVKDHGLLDIRIIQPIFKGNFQDGTRAEFITLDSLELTPVGFNEVEVFNEIISEGYTTFKEVELKIADDSTGFSQAFRLGKLDEKNEAIFNAIEIPVLDSFSQFGKFYSVVSLYGANLIKDNIDDVFHSSLVEVGNDGRLYDLDVIYNYRNGEQMVVETPTPITSGYFEVRRYKIKDVAADRSSWVEWSDSLYPIENDGYLEAVAKVYKRLFITPHERVDFTQIGAVKFNDLLNFNYIGSSNYFIVNCSWDVDRNSTNITMIKAVYQNEVIDDGGGDGGGGGAVNLPPLVNAGPDKEADISNPLGFPGVNILATAYDPDGFIASVKWEVVSGQVIFNSTDTLGIYVLLVSVEAVLMVTVTDSEGLTASDTVKIYKVIDYQLILNQYQYYNVDGLQLVGEARKSDTLLFSPALGADDSITVKGTYRLRVFEMNHPRGPYPGTVSFQIEKNGNLIVNVTKFGNVLDNSGNFEFNYIEGDVVRFNILCYAQFVAQSRTNYIRLRSEYEINNVSFSNSTASITGYPAGKSIEYKGVN